MTLCLRKIPEMMVFREALKEERDIFDDPVLGSSPVSWGDMDFSHLFNEYNQLGGLLILFIILRPANQFQSLWMSHELQVRVPFSVADIQQCKFNPADLQRTFKSVQMGFKVWRLLSNYHGEMSSSSWPLVLQVEKERLLQAANLANNISKLWTVNSRQIQNTK